MGKKTDMILAKVHLLWGIFNPLCLKVNYLCSNLNIETLEMCQVGSYSVVDTLVLVVFSFFCCACRGAVRGWAELSSTEAAVTRSPAAGQHLLIKPCLPCCLLPDDFTSSMWYMAQVRSSFFMTSSLFCSLGDLTFSGVLSTTSVYQQADFQCLQL